MLFYDLQDYLQLILCLNYNCNIYIILWKIVEDKKIVSDIRYFYVCRLLNVDVQMLKQLDNNILINFNINEFLYYFFIYHIEFYYSSDQTTHKFHYHNYLNNKCVTCIYRIYFF